jgi:hypothetical protein
MNLGDPIIGNESLGDLAASDTAVKKEKPKRPPPPVITMSEIRVKVY